MLFRNERSIQCWGSIRFTWIMSSIVKNLYSSWWSVLLVFFDSGLPPRLSGSAWREFFYSWVEDFWVQFYWHTQVMGPPRGVWFLWCRFFGLQFIWHTQVMAPPPPRGGCLIWFCSGSYPWGRVSSEWIVGSFRKLISCLMDLSLIAKEF